MPRVSREERARNHERVLREASRLVREKGADAVSVPEVMAAAGLTHGGFYKHFASKDDLLAQAGRFAFTERRDFLADLVAASSDQAATRERFVEAYLSTWHRDNPADGCAGVALAADSARRDDDDSLHRAYATGVREMAGALQSLRDDAGGGGATDGSDTQTGPDTGGVGPEGLADLATLVGAVVLARATTGEDLSERVLAAARERLLGG